MTHHDAQREMSVERYLLGELQGDARDQFEDHLFDCELCSADLQAGIAFTEAIKSSGPRLVSRPVTSPVEQPATAPLRLDAKKKSSWAASLLQPWIAGPALAACLALLCVQSFVVQPRLRHELAEAQTPRLIDEVVVNGTTRGLEPGQVQAHPGGGFLISVEITAEPRFKGYRCTLVSPAGRPVWHTYLSPAQVNDTVIIHVPVGSTASGLNVLKVEGIPQPERAAAVPLFERRFNLTIGE